MTRIRREHASRRRRRADGQLFVKPETPLTPLPEGKVRCPVCMQPTSLTPRGKLRQHRTGDGEECLQRILGDEPTGQLVAPPVVLPKPLKEPVRVRRTPEGRGPRVSGECETCGRVVSGERRFCGQCLRRRI